ncbi:DUF5305 family protein [Halobiforma nitratireducens]|uniref:DUF5305 domain-containing protein n=1 Tax=Halobiforma nitratireducens JCM 10879 TaxID=1227454 RepID=M0LFQ2_9EURY|nr:DUF5305 family protein [Halobiforma nitratireducens]EMA32376.1 hypothetical protein C446_14729 [Halobiforma nitratireducens JCM 10879]
MATNDTDDANAEPIGTAETGWLELRALLAEYRTALVIAFVVLLTLGAWMSYGAYAEPGVETNQRLESAWTATGELSHQATVTESTEVFPNGTVLEDEPLYYAAIAPELEGEFAAGYEADSARDVEVTVTVDLVYSAEDPEAETVYWHQEERLVSVNESSVEPGEAVDAAFAVDVTEVGAAIDEIENELGASPGQTDIRLEIEREIEGEIEGEYRRAVDPYAVSLEYDGNTYELEGADTYDETHDEEYETVTTPATPGPLRSIGGPAVLGVGLVGLVGTAVASRRLPEPTRAEREWLAYRDHHEQYAGVITRARLPPSTCADESERHGTVTVESLEELAGLGIDVGAAILFDRRTDRYVVRHGGTTYVYDPPSPPTAVTDAGDPVERAGDTADEVSAGPASARGLLSRISTRLGSVLGESARGDEGEGEGERDGSDKADEHHGSTTVWEPGRSDTDGVRISSADGGADGAGGRDGDDPWPGENEPTHTDDWMLELANDIGSEEGTNDDPTVANESDARELESGVGNRG